MYIIIEIIPDILGSTQTGFSFNFFVYVKWYKGKNTTVNQLSVAY